MNERDKRRMGKMLAKTREIVKRFTSATRDRKGEWDNAPCCESYSVAIARLVGILWMCQKHSNGYGRTIYYGHTVEFRSGSVVVGETYGTCGW